MTDIQPLREIAPIASRSTAARVPDLRRTAEALEASFLAEMLKHAGLEGKAGTFGGGIGETQFASFLRDEQAREMVRAGGIGLAETIFETLKARGGENAV